MTIPNGLPDHWFPDIAPSEDPAAAQDRGRIEHTLATARRQGTVTAATESHYRGRLEADFYGTAAELEQKAQIPSTLKGSS